MCIKEAKIPAHNLEEKMQTINEVFGCFYSPLRKFECFIQDAIMVYEHIPYSKPKRGFLPYMQPKIHCKVNGKLFAAVIDRQKIDTSFALKDGFPGLTLDSGGIWSVPAVPTNTATSLAFLQMIRGK